TTPSGAGSGGSAPPCPRWTSAPPSPTSPGSPPSIGGFWKNISPPESILHRHEIEPVGRRDLAAGAAVACRERGGKIVGAPFAVPDQHQRTRHRPHPLLQHPPRARL